MGGVKFSIGKIRVREKGQRNNTEGGLELDN
jgi:hypothetical protein